jgi:hypothetical protein
MFVVTQSMDRASDFESLLSGDDEATQSRLSSLRPVFDKRSTAVSDKPACEN